MEINKITEAIVDSAFHIQRDLGPGLLESVYEVLLADALMERGMVVQRQIPIQIRIGSKVFDEGFRADLIVESRVIVEVKSVESIARVHGKQLKTYLRLSGLPVGLVVNFGGDLLKGNVQRVVVGDAPDLKAQVGSLS